MALSLHTNAASLSTQNAVNKTQQALNTSLTRLGTGYRVNSSQDDAAGLQISTRLLAQTRGIAVAQKNTQNGISLLQTADGGLDELTNLLLRQKDLATEAFTASTSADDKKALQAEYDELGKELLNIITNTTFGGARLFSGNTTAATLGAADSVAAVAGLGGLLAGSSAVATTIDFQTGASAAEKLTVGFGANVTGLAAALVKVSANYTSAGATVGTELTNAAATNGIIDTIQKAIDTVGTLRSQLGATANRLEHIYTNLGNISTNTNAARGRIVDVDYAQEASNSTAKQLLLQAGTSSLKQSNSLSQLVLSLLN